LHCFRKGDVAGALAFARNVAVREPNSESVKNVAVALVELGRAEEAAAWTTDHKGLLDPIQYHDLLCAQYAKLGKIAEAVAHGDEALRLKDESALPRDLPNPIVRPFDVDVWEPSAGHDICADDPWINGRATDPNRALAFHPFAAEQKAVAQLVLDAL